MGDIIASDEEADKPPLVISSCSGLEMTGKAEGEESAAAAISQAAPTYNPYYCLHPNIEMKKNRLGKGLYATAPIYEGETIYDASKSTTLARVDSKTIQTWPAEQIDFFETYSWQVGDDLWSGPTCKNDLQKDYVNYLNHSCDPNTWFVGDEVLVARRDIQPGEEITYDYATSDIVVAPFLVQGCLCGSAKCRKRISPWDYRLPSLQAAYGEHFMPYILEHIATEPKLELGTGMYASLHKAVELKPSPCGGYKGLGLFASDLIPLGTIVWCAEHEPVESAQATVEEIASFSKDKKEWFLNFGYQVDKDTISSVRSIEDLERDAGYYMNHSCDPNLWFVGDKLLVASRDIHPGEELTYDYGTNSSLFERISECKCGAPECRGRITTKDYLLPQLQERYNHHFSLFILADILNAQN